MTGRRAHETALERAGHTVSGALSSGIPDPSPGGAHGECNLPRAALQRDTALVHPSEYYPMRHERDTTLVHARRLVSVVDDLQCRYCARKLSVYGLVRPQSEILQSCTHRYTPRAARNGDTTLVHARRPVSGVDDIQRQYCARKLTEYGLVRP